MFITGLFHNPTRRGDMTRFPTSGAVRCILLFAVAASGCSDDDDDDPVVAAAPGGFLLIFPADGGFPETGTPTLTWSASAGAEGYVVQLSLSSSFSPLLHSSPTLVAGTTAYPVPFGLLSAGQTGYWRVTASAGGTETAAGNAPFRFTVVRPSWAKTYGGAGSEMGNTVQATSDGGYVVAERTDSFGAGMADAWVIRLNADGDIVWQKAFGGAGNEFARSVRQTSDGGFVVLGYTNSFGAGGFDVWLLRLDSGGAILWQKTYGGASSDFGHSVQQTGDGGFILAGVTSSFGAGSSDAWLIKTDVDGNVTWQKAYGGASGDSAFSVQSLSGGGYVLGGSTNSFGSGLSDGWVLRVDDAGVPVMQKCFGTTANEVFQSVRETPDGGLVAAGHGIAFGFGGWDVWVMRLASDDSVSWQKAYGGAALDQAFSLQPTPDGGCITAGFTVSFGSGLNDVWVLKLAGDGTVEWQKAYGGIGNDHGVSVIQTSGGGFAVAGRTDSFGSGGWDLWMVKMAADGTVSPLGLDTAVVPVDVAALEVVTTAAGTVSAATVSSSGAVATDTAATVQSQAP